MKGLLKTAVLVITALILVCTAFAATASDDPADSYQKQTAPAEDNTLSMWFEHSAKKVLTSDKSPSGMDTYSAYMAKNEIENIQFVLYSDTTKAGMSATVSEFKDALGNTIPA